MAKTRITSQDIGDGLVTTADMAATAVTPGAYTNTNLTVDAAGRLTAAANGSAGVSSHSVLDSTVHSDTLTGTVVRGDLILGNATPKWSRLAVGASARLFQSDGTDPSWVALSGDATIAAGGALTLASTISAAGPIGSTTVVPVITYDAKGRLTTVTTATIATQTSTLLTSTVHTDTLTGTVVRGDVIIGNSTPKWARLAIGAPSTVFQTNGTDPSWAKITDSNVATAAGIDPQKIGSGAVDSSEFDTLDGVTSSIQSQLDAKQGLDTDLTEIAAVANVRGDLLLTNSGPTWVRLAAGAAGRLLQSDGTDPSYVAVSGDATLAAGGALTLASTISAGGPTGSATVAPIITYDAKGRLTTVTSATITPAVGSITGLGTGVATWLATPSSVNLLAAVTDETGTGALVFATSPTLVTPLLGTPTSGTLTNCTGLPTAGLVNDAVTYAKMQNVSATSRVLGRITAGAGDPEELTGANLATIANASFDHNALTNLTVGDVHTQYALLAGRSGGQVFVGGTSSSNSLDLDANTAAFSGFNTGSIRFLDRCGIFPDATTFDSVIVCFGLGSSAAGHEWTVGASGTTIEGFTQGAEIVVSGDNVGPISWLSFPRPVRYTAAQTGSAPYFYRAGPQLISDGVTGLKLNLAKGFYDALVTNVANSGTFDGTTCSWAGFYSGPALNGGTFRDRYGAYVAEPSGAGGLTNNIAFAVEALTKGATQNTAFQSVGTTTDVRIAGPMRVGATGAPTAGITLDCDGKFNLWPDQPAPSATTTNAFNYTPVFTTPQNVIRTVVGLNLQQSITVDSGTTGIFSFFGAIGGGALTFLTNGLVPPTYTLFQGSPTLTSATTSVPPASPSLFLAQPTIQATANNVGTVTAANAFFDRTTVKALTSSGAVLTLTDLISFQSNVTVTTANSATVAVTNRRGFFHVAAAGMAGSSTIGTDVAVDVQDTRITGVTNAYAVRSAITAGANAYFLRDTGGAQSYLVGKFTTYNNTTTKGFGLATVVAAARSAAATAAVASVATYTNAAADGTFRVSANVLVTTATVHSFTVTCAYTDEGNTARTLTLPFSSLAGAVVTAIANAAGAVPYEGVAMHIRCKASTAITIATTGTFTTVTYNVDGLIEQLA